MAYRPVEQDQPTFLPPALGDLIPENDLCRVVDAFVDSLSRAVVEDKFRRHVGNLPHHPRVMLKIILYAYTQRLYSCRKIAAATTRDVHFMWLAGGNHPSFNTVNRFRGDYLREILPAAFAALAQLLLEKRIIRTQDYFVDGTILDADANKNSHVWRKNVARFKQRVQERAAEILAEADAVNVAEDALYGAADLPEKTAGAHLSAAEIREAAQKLSASDDARQQKSGASLTKEAVKLERYEAQEKTLGTRNSYSKTDPDATFMRTKDDLLRPAYNPMPGVQDGFITGVSVGQNPNDAVGFIAHMEARDALGLPPPPTVTGDSIFGTEENYAYLEQKQIGNYLKYPSWLREQRGQLKPYEKAAFVYDEVRDVFTCPQGKTLAFVEEKQTTTESGYAKAVRVYECGACADCPVKSDCTSSAGGRRVQDSAELNRYRCQARENLSSAAGVQLRKRRSSEVETVFGHLKRNGGFRRFSLRGLPKVRLEFTWQALGYNLTRLVGRLKTLGMGWNPFGRAGKPFEQGENPLNGGKNPFHRGGNPLDRVQKAGLGRFLTA